MDLEIHRDVIGEPSFKGFLNEKAADLARRLQDVLALLCARPEEVDDGYNNLSGTELTSVFRQALDVLCQLVRTGHSYVYTWHAPKDRFDPTSMKTEYVVSDGDSSSAVVELTLFPGIRQLPKDYLGAGHGLFLDSSPKISGEGECLVSALVSLDARATDETGPDNMG